jgi:hypothetical protein
MDVVLYMPFHRSEASYFLVAMDGYFREFRTVTARMIGVVFLSSIFTGAWCVSMVLRLGESRKL